MPRSSVTGSLRVGNGLTLNPSSPPTGAGRGSATANKTPYTEALVKLFPAEGVTLAPLIQPIAQGDSVLTLVLVAAVVLLIILLRRVPNEPQGGGATDWLAIGVAVVSFLLYAATLRIFGLFLNPPERHTLLMSFITIVWVAAVPLIPQRR